MQKSHSSRAFSPRFWICLCAFILLPGGCATPPATETVRSADTVSQSSQSSRLETPAGEAANACPVCPVCPSVSVPAVPSVPVASDATPRLHAAAWTDLPGWQTDQLQEAWPAFLLSCEVWKPCRQGKSTEVCARLQESGARERWQSVCRKAVFVKGDNEEIRRFFEKEFQPYAIVEGNGQNEGLITGYYEPLIKGSRQRDAQNNVPVLGVPPDMLTIDLSELYPDLKHLRLRGRVVGNRVVPYWSRAEIEARPEGQWPGKPILWVADPVEFFFLQIQGSGRVELPDGRYARIGYADQNGYPYRSIGRVLIERGDLKPEEASMQGIQAWARKNPGRLRALLNENPSYVFFRELPEDESERVRRSGVNNGIGNGRVADTGPLGAMGVPLTAERSVAVDARYITLGAPLWLAATYPNSAEPLNRLVVAQDTGGAIKGGVRADFFWGFGKEAGQQAGRMKQKGRIWLILPRGARQ